MYAVVPKGYCVFDYPTNMYLVIMFSADRRKMTLHFTVKSLKNFITFCENERGLEVVPIFYREL